ncbi:hypothetical protein CMK11_04115 [Candidatus Poribacteria bacterium]|nr:hypothetical protein [Candidatus Poribacteria bacterium]
MSGARPSRASIVVGRTGAIPASDQWLVRRCVGGDDDAVATLLRRYEARVYSIAYARLLNHADAQDVTQDTFVRAYERLRQLKQPDSFAAWIARIAFTRCQDHVRRHGRETPMESPHAEAAEPAAQPGQAEFERSHDLVRLVTDALEQLPDSYRVPIVMQYMADASVREIAEALMISEVGAERRLGRAREMLRQYFRRTGRVDIALDVLGSGALLIPAGLSMVENALDHVAGREPQPEASHEVSIVKVAGAVAIGAAIVVALFAGGARSGSHRHPSAGRAARARAACAPSGRRRAVAHGRRLGTAGRVARSWVRQATAGPDPGVPPRAGRYGADGRPRRHANPRSRALDGEPGRRVRHLRHGPRRERAHQPNAAPSR